MEKGTESVAEEVKRFEKIYDMGHGLIIAKVPIKDVKEQDINARIMKDDMQSLLTENITKRGQLESLPLLADKDGKLEIVSGHHRVKSAKAAGIEELISIIDVSGLTRSQIAAKQLAHNAIEGFDDESTLKEICKAITDVDDMIESAMPKEYFNEIQHEVESLATPALDFDFKTVTFTFLPHQLHDLENVIKSIPAGELLGYADIDQFKSFADAVEKTKKYENIKAVGTAIYQMVKLTEEHYADYDENEDWQPLVSLFGGGAVSAEDAEIIKKALQKAKNEKVITDKTKSRLVIELCKEYLGE